MEKRENKENNSSVIIEKDGKEGIFFKCQKEYSGVDIKMLQHNIISGFLNLRIRHVDEYCIYFYDVTGCCSLTEYFIGKQIDYKMIKKLYRDITEIYRNCQEYFLQERNCILQPEYLYWNERKREWMICYIPESKTSAEEQLELLNQYLLRQINHKDKQCVKFIYGIYELIQQKGYYLDGMERYIGEFILEENSEEQQKKVVGKKRVKSKQTPVFRLKKNVRDSCIPDRVEMSTGEFRIGRLEDNDLVLPMAQISRRHAKITIEEDGLYLYDCQSTNGTSLNGIKIAGNQEVSCQEKDVISFGNISYIIEKI